MLDGQRQRFDDLTVAQRGTLDNDVTALTSILDTADGEHAASTQLKGFPPIQEGQSKMLYGENLERRSYG